MRSPRRLSFLALLVFLSACELPSETRPVADQMFSSREFPAVGMEAVYEVTLAEMRRMGLQVDSSKSNRHAGKFETYWTNFLSPFRYEGRRRKLLGEIKENEAVPGRFRVLATVWVQRNADIEDPLDSSKAIWQDVEPDQTTAERLLMNVERHFPDFGGDTTPPEDDEPEEYR
jgi:hypothetical protein